jgi:Helix-hairpin-helix containing domain
VRDYVLERVKEHMRTTHGTSATPTGIGFKTADRIAQAVGIPHDSPQRVHAGIQYTLSQAADRGHCYLPEPNLVSDAAQILDIPAALVRTCLAELAVNEGVIGEPVPNPVSEGATIPAGIRSARVVDRRSRAAASAVSARWNAQYLHGADVA